jgi:hypothetical protein
MKPINILPFLSLLLLLVPSIGNTAGSMLRIACDGSNKGADVEVNGKFKGQCPLDLQVPEGTVDLKVRQVIDDLQERIYAEKMRIGDGVVKKVEVELGSSKLSAKGKQYYSKYLSEDVQQRADSGNVEAMIKISGYFLHLSKGEAGPSAEKAALYIRQAADAGHPKAMAQLSKYYAKGQAGLPKSEQDCLKWLLRAAEAGDADSMFDLAFAYGKGLYGLKQDYVQMDYWLRKKAEIYIKEAKAGNPDSMTKIGDCYFAGLGVEENRAEGSAWHKRAAATYRKLADSGNVDAMRALSLSFYDENGEKMSGEQKQYWKMLAKTESRPLDDIKELREFVRRTEGAKK